jgi:hypothetical protein
VKNEKQPETKSSSGKEHYEEQKKTDGKATQSTEPELSVPKQEMETIKYLPSFNDMDSSLTEDDIVFAISLTHTFLTLTYLNPFPFEQDPVFYGLFEINCKLFKDPKTSINYSQCIDSYREKYDKNTSKVLIDMAESNKKLFENFIVNRENTGFRLLFNHVVNCIADANLLDNSFLVINWSYILLKSNYSHSLPKERLNQVLDILSSHCIKVDYWEPRNYLLRTKREINQ